MNEHSDYDVNNPDYQHPKSGRILSGILLIIFGVIFFASQLGVNFPQCTFTWPVFLIALGLYVGAKHMFRNPGWLILVGIGAAFLFSTYFPDLEIHRFIWPSFLIIAGLFVVFKPFKRKFNYDFHKKFHKRFHKDYLNQINEPMGASYYSDETFYQTDQDHLESIAILGGIKKNVISKNFKGGEVICIMGGAEINLSQADIQGTIVLEMIQILGGAKLIVPSNWEIRSEAMVILGGIEDKRQQVIDHNAASASSKVLILRGTCVFGGIDIRSY